ncbi:MAG: hypothetical protein ACRCX2_04885 [Paraclostridium sp.]
MDNKQDDMPIDVDTMIQSGFMSVLALLQDSDQKNKAMMSMITNLAERIHMLEQQGQQDQKQAGDIPKQLINDPNAKQADPLSQLLSGLLGGGNSGSQQ